MPDDSTSVFDDTPEPSPTPEPLPSPEPKNLLQPTDNAELDFLKGAAIVLAGNAILVCFQLGAEMSIMSVLGKTLGFYQWLFVIPLIFVCLDQGSRYKRWGTFWGVTLLAVSLCT